MFTALKKPLIAVAAVALASVGVAAPSAAGSSHKTTDAASTTAGQAAGKATPWTAWKKAGKSEPSTLSGCSTKLRLSDAVNRTEYRTRTDRDGNFLYQFRGTLHQRIDPKRGHKVVVDISGPGTITLYPNDDLHFRARGANMIYSSPKVYQASNPTRIPRLSLTMGSISLFSDGNGTPRIGDDQFTFLNRPDRHWNICSVVRTGVVPKPFRV